MKILIILFLLICSSVSFAQNTDQQLANLYYNSNEYDKALLYFEKIITKKSSKFDQMRYVECLEKTGKNKEAEKFLKKAFQDQPNDHDYLLALGNFYENDNQLEDRDKLYNGEIKRNAKQGYLTVALYNSFLKKGKTEWALKTLESGKKELKKNYDFSEQFAEIYAVLGKNEEMIDIYFEMLEKNPNYITTAQSNLSRIINFQTDTNGVYTYLRVRLLEKIKKEPSETIFPSMLIWLFVQKKEFTSALTQTIALDKREKGNGNRIFNLADICLENNDYEVARLAYQYIVDQGKDHPRYVSALTAILNVRYREIVVDKNTSELLISSTLTEYSRAISEFGIRRGTLSLCKEAAELNAFYANNTRKAAEILDTLLSLPELSDIERAEIKMKLGDVAVLENDIWTASIYYMQIDKDFKFEAIGSEAKFKNARIFYYDGDFEFSQSQLDILKQSTTKLIANDAMKLSVLITDNLGLDSNYTAMYQFAQADLLLEQHRFSEAFSKYDSIKREFPDHGLADEILLRRAQAAKYQGKWEEAISYLNDIYTFYGQDILVDDAIFQMAEIYELQLNDKPKAEEYYKKILFECKGSLLTIEARKRYRNLRGDEVDLDKI